MLSVSTGHSMGYLTDAVGGGMDYYTGEAAAGEPPGVWWGRGAQSLGLAGTVDPEVIAAISELHLDPSDELFADPGTRHEARTLGRPPKRFRSPDEVVAARIEEYTRVHSDTSVPEQVRAWQQEAEASAAKAVHFYDMTFSPDKSVTVLYVTCVRAGYAARGRGDAAGAQQWEWRAQQIEEAVMQAGAAGLEYVADHAGYTRVGRHGGRGATGRWDDAHDLIAAQFLQHTSRDHDPQLHVHQPIINRVAGSDGAWRALDGRGLYTVRPAAGAVMERELETELTRRLGVAWEMREDGLSRRVAGIDPAVEDLFSSRRKAITARAEQMLAEYEAATGRPVNSLVRSRIMQQATLSTRRSKDSAGLTWEESVAAWDAKARTEVAGGLEHQARVFDHATAGQRPAPETFSRSAVIAQALENCHSDDGRATWTRHDLVQQIARALPDNLGHLPAGGFRALVETLADEAMATGDVIQTSGRSVGTQVPDAARLANGQAATVDPSSVRHATRGQVAAEIALLRSAGVRGRTCVPRADVEAWLSELDAAAGGGSGLLPAQREALAGLASSDAALAVLVGPAGTGKSYTAGAFAAAWADLTAGRVVGVATTQVAADVLADDGVPHTANVAAFLAAHARLADHRPKPGDGDLPGDEQLRLGPRDVLVVDEASMVDTASLTQLQTVVEAAGARMVLMGDPRQLGPVGAGGMMRAAIDRDAETYTLGEVRRFAHDWERAASLRLRDGDPGAIGDYDAHGRILDAGTEDQAVAAVARAAAADRIDGHDVVVVTATNEHATAVAGEVRRHLVAAGLVEETGVLLGRDHSTAGVGDVVQARRIDRGLGLVNRETYRVTAVRDDGGVDVVSTRTGRELVMPAAYLAGDVTLAYASTAHGAQGRTVDTGHVLLTGHLDRAGAYVGLTRGRDSNTAWAVTETGVPDDPTVTGRAMLGRVVGQDAAAEADGGIAEAGPDLAAVESLDADHARRASAATLLGLIEDESRLACRERLDADLDQLVTNGVLSAADRARFGSDQGSEHLARLLRAQEQAGHDPAAVLRSAIENHRRSLADAVSVAQVVAARIDKAAGLPAPDVAASDAAPRHVPGDRARYLDELRDLLGERERTLGAALAADPPAWAASTLGAVPDDPADRADWEQRAGVIAAQREAVGWESETVPLGRCPGVSAPEKRANWHRAYTAAGMPDERRPEAEMSDGRLLSRAAAARRARAAAPADVYNAQRERHRAAEEARRDAVLARAAGRDEEAAQLEAAAAEHAAAAEQLDEIAVTRAEHHAAYAETYTAGEAAEEELIRRGKAPGAEPDRGTAEQHLEWMDAERAAREADDAHRVITETDLTDHDGSAAGAGYGREGTVERAAGGTAQAETADAQQAPARELSASAATAEVEAAAAHAAARRDELADVASQDAAAAEDDEWHLQQLAAAPAITDEAASAAADGLS